MEDELLFMKATVSARHAEANLSRVKVGEVKLEEIQCSIIDDKKKRLLDQYTD